MDKGPFYIKVFKYSVSYAESQGICNKMSKLGAFYRLRRTNVRVKKLISLAARAIPEAVS